MDMNQIKSPEKQFLQIDTILAGAFQEDWQNLEVSSPTIQTSSSSSESLILDTGLYSDKLYIWDVEIVKNVLVKFS